MTDLLAAAHLPRGRGFSATARVDAHTGLWTADESQGWGRGRGFHAVADLDAPVVTPPTPVFHMWRVSPVYPTPTLDAAGRPVDWHPSSVTVEYWGRLRVVGDGADRTVVHGAPVTVGSWESASPFGDSNAEISWPVTPFETVGTGALSFIRGGPNYDIQVVRPDATIKTLFAGWSASVESLQDDASYSKGLHLSGALYQADAQKHQPPFTSDPRDIGKAIAVTLNTALHRRYSHIDAVTTGIPTSKRGSRDQDKLTGYCQDLLGDGTTDDGQHQWSVEQTAPRRYAIQWKKSPAAGDSADFYYAVGTPGLRVQLSRDILSAPRRIFAEAITPAGDVTGNTKAPNFHPDDSTPYPNTSPTNFITLGETDADTDSGTGVTDLQRRLHDTFDTGCVVTGTYDSATREIVEDFQAKAMGAAFVDGIVGPQTWTTLFAIGSNVGDLTGMYYAPFAEDGAVEPYLHGATGAIVGPNPADDPTQIVVDRFESLGEGLTKAQVFRSARAELARDHTPGVYGTITGQIDPEGGSRWETRAGQIMGLRYFEGATLTKLYVVNMAADPNAGTVTWTVDSKARDLMTVAALIERDKAAALDRARRRNVKAQSKQPKDIAVQYDGDAGFGIVPRLPLLGGFPVMIRIPVGWGSRAASITLTTTGPAAPFAGAIFGLPNTVGDVRRALGGATDPTVPTDSGYSLWTERADELAALGFVTAWGMDGQRAGYDPLSQTTPSGSSPPVTGRFTDNGGFDFISGKPPWLWLYLFSPDSCFIHGRIKMSPLT